MDCWTPVQLTAAVRPVLLEGETVAVMQKDVGLYEGKTRLQEFDNGILTVTSHRILWIDESKETGLQLSLSKTRGVDHSSGIWKASSPKIILTLSAGPGQSALAQVPIAGVSIPSNVMPVTSPPTTSSPEIRWTCSICAHLNNTMTGKCDLCGVTKILPPTPPALAAPASAVASGPSQPSRNSTSPRRSPITHQSFQISPTSHAPPRAQTECPVCTFLNHSDLQACEICEAVLPKEVPPPASSAAYPAPVRMDKTTPTTPAVLLDVSASRSSAVMVADSDNNTVAIIKLSFRAGGIDQCVRALKSALAERAWERQVVAVELVRPAPVQTAPGLGGISSIMRNVEQFNARVTTTVDEAFSDLDALMDKAADMVKLAESISNKLAQTSATHAGADDSLEMATFRSYLIELGVDSPVTKKSTGDMYATELARQLADFLHRALATRGGMIALTDLYCLFNRARGSALISPNDLRASCRLFESLRLPFRVRQFASGLLVVQAGNHSDDETIARVIKRVAAAENGLSATDLARLENISVVLATEQLLLAESNGGICRDDTVQGLCFFDNILKNYTIPPVGR
ncbi:Vacuolar protein-sorting-associated protein 36 [Geranomyces variabilis]|uniref:Vacuolar protein-sorting-associated protein 36 n=1 Tax=Geranomyces variabilis TaxID=109894 RepID=A0AAD5XMX7_9FUNG|nr:Vacuolar protein-sorting-associated protein 36 [Geranomyces variabilis]